MHFMLINFKETFCLILNSMYTLCDNPIYDVIKVVQRYRYIGVYT